MLYENLTIKQLKNNGVTPTRFTFKSGLRLELRDNDSWAIMDGASCVNKQGGWEYEPMPSHRTADFIKRCRFTFDDAMEIACNIEMNP